MNITVDEWILESTRPRKHVQIPEIHIFWHTFAEHDSVPVPFYLLNSFHNSMKRGSFFFLEACFAMFSSFDLLALWTSVFPLNKRPVDLMNTIQELLSNVLLRNSQSMNN